MKLMQKSEAEYALAVQIIGDKLEIGVADKDDTECYTVVFELFQDGRYRMRNPEGVCTEGYLVVRGDDAGFE